jgi:hypothetical protein
MTVIIILLLITTTIIAIIIIIIIITSLLLLFFFIIIIIAAILNAHMLRVILHASRRLESFLTDVTHQASPAGHAVGETVRLQRARPLEFLLAHWTHVDIFTRRAPCLVRLEFILASEGLVAIFALVTLECGVGLLVAFEVGQLHKGFLADVAGVLPLLLVVPGPVELEPLTPGEGLVAHIADVIFLPCVDQLVQPEVVGEEKRFAAHITHMLLSPRVQQAVGAQVGFAAQRLVAHAAHVSLLLGVDNVVAPQVRDAPESSSAYFTGLVTLHAINSGGGV